MANIYDMTDTWNDGATTFTGIKMDVTDTASAAGSKLLDLQVGGTPKATIDEGGKLTLTGDIDVGTNKLYYSNVFSTTGDLPSATSYHGMFAHVHAEGAAYFAHGGSWQKLANSGEVGTAGQDGDSAYQVWLDAGNTGSEQDFLDSLVGAAGAPGAAGQDGNDGQQGIQGIQGSPGNDGNDGAQGIQGIQGPAGNDGNDGAQGIQGIQGPAGPATTDIDGTTVDIRKAKIEVPATSVDLGGDARLYSVATTGITLTMDDTALSEGDIVTIYANGFDVTIAQDGTNGFDTVKIDGTTAAHTGNVTVANGTVATISVISTTAGSSFAVITGQGVS